MSRKIRALPNSACVVKVGGGRGFIIEQCIRVNRRRIGKLRLQPFVDRRLVVTAAHCLPHLPPADQGSHAYERTYKDLLSSLDGAKKNVWAECLFADPVADIAEESWPQTGIPGKPRPWLISTARPRQATQSRCVRSPMAGSSSPTGPILRPRST
jgi:hypothetical protein